MSPIRTTELGEERKVVFKYSKIQIINDLVKLSLNRNADNEYYNDVGE